MDRWVAWAATGGAVFLLFWPFPSMGRGVEGWDKSVHAMLFAVLAWAWVRCLGEEARRRWRVVLALAAAAALVEILQPLTGRSRDWMDALGGMTGACWVGLCGTRGKERWALAAAGTAVVAGLWCGGGWLRWRAEKAAWPTLADGEAAWGVRQWHCHATRTVAGEGGIRVEWTGKKARWPGIFRKPLVRDWRGRGALRLQISWPEEREVTAVVRVDDSGVPHPKYADRYQKHFTLAKGENTVEIPADEWGRKTGGEAMDAEHMARWGVFLVEPGDFSYFLLRKAELE